MRKAQSAGKEEGADGLEGKAEVRGDPVSCSDSVLGDWLVLTGSQAEETQRFGCHHVLLPSIHHTDQTWDLVV